MSNVCSCCCKLYCKLCCCCCYCLKCIVGFFFDYLISFSYVSLCCCVFGMLLMAGILLTYYSTFYPTTPSAALEHTGMYDYVHENPILKRDVSHETMDFDDDDYDYEPGVPAGAGKREIGTPMEEGKKELLRREISSESPQTDRGRSTTARQGPNATSKGKANGGTATPAATTADPGVFLPDLTHANALLDSVFAKADASNLTQSLGLCRKNADFKAPDYRPPPFPANAASDVLSCVNDLVAAQNAHTLCVHLDPEMNAYLKWLILTGVPKEKFQPARAGTADDFLFPSTCGTESHQPGNDTLAEIALDSTPPNG